MMKIKVNLYGSLRRFSNMPGGGQWEGDFPEKTSISKVVEAIGIKNGEIAHMNVNGNIVDENYLTHENDKIIFVTNVEGG